MALSVDHTSEEISAASNKQPPTKVVGEGFRQAGANAAGAGNIQGQRMQKRQCITLGAVLLAVLVSLAFDTGIGTPSAFGLGKFFLLCPLGGLEAMAAARTFIPLAAISLAVVCAFTLLFGRAWCAWGCPVPPVRRFFKREPDRMDHIASAGAHNLSYKPHQKASSITSKLRYIGCDRRTWVFLAVLLAAGVAGLPIFCLVCPIGLTFGSVASLWNLIVNKQVTLSVVVFPLALVVETLLYRKWCLNLCPVAGFLNIVGQFAPLFRPVIDTSTCLCHNGGSCQVCTAVCAENIDKHAENAVLQLGECTRCGVCAASCPTASITIQKAPHSLAHRPDE